MLRYVGKRFGMMIITLFIITTITFFMMHTIPGGPLDAQANVLPQEIKDNYNAKYGLDQPIHIQYQRFLKNLLTEGDLGMSFKYPGRFVSKIISSSAPISARIGIQALAVGIPIGIILGITAALNKGKWPDYVISVVAIIGITVPVFILASIFQLVFAAKLGWFPSSGWGGFKYTVVPTLAMCLGPIAGYSRYMKSNMLEVMNQDYVLTADAKGVSRLGIIFKHIFRNAILPLITMIGPQIAGIFTGSFIVESMFGIPGLGYYYVSAIQNRDYNMIIGTTVFYAALFVFSQLVVDILYGVVDPRIRIGRE